MDFVFSTCKGAFIGCCTNICMTAGKELYKSKFQIDEKLIEILKGELIIAAKSSLTYSFLNNTLILVLERYCNKEKDFERSLFIKASAAAISTLVVNGIIRNKINWYSLIVDPTVGFFLAMVTTILSEWEEGGRQYISEKFPKTFEAVGNTEIIQVLEDYRIFKYK
ncbi:hypothetical protein TRFO_23794 [Tritrichomonas foetus]|uniref:Uncharacterized protein n=1 Tax=Tritrichomonas foetus TaxID=1144522 RepID=A0A1J4K8M5_9EUKA|nr:hypothetical protein TRFO_23794 [Tritrichomonas foetus]|eukprot:OHT07849.1 hypothetical protein TRFO_23794 [Tritrichomonas foetus]